MKYRQSLGSMRAKSHSPLKTPPIQQHAYILSRKKGAVLYGKASKQVVGNTGEQICSARPWVLGLVTRRL